MHRSEPQKQQQRLTQVISRVALSWAAEASLALDRSGRERMAIETTSERRGADALSTDFTLASAHVLDVESLLAQVPPRATVKGMFWGDLLKLAAGLPVSLAQTRHSPFGDYPLVDYMRAVALVARTAHPKSSAAEGIRRVGERGFGVLASSLAGKVLFALAGRDLKSTLGLVSQAYRRSLDPGDARIALLERGRAVVELRSIWNFPTAYQVGVFEGALRNFGHDGSVQIRVHSACDVDYLIEWR